MPQGPSPRAYSEWPVIDGSTRGCEVRREPRQEMDRVRHEAQQALLKMEQRHVAEREALQRASSQTQQAGQEIAGLEYFE